MSWLNSLVRPEILALKPYEPASWDPAFTRLHANEWPHRLARDPSAAGLNRYPEPHSSALVSRLSRLYAAHDSSLLVGRGSDELIDLLVRAFCRAEHDAVLVCPPTFGMYANAARIQGAQLVSVPLLAERSFSLDTAGVLEACASNPVKVLFLCSPNNPTGNLLDRDDILTVAWALRGRGLVVVDEAYVEFSGQESLATQLGRYPNLAILRTLSKAHGLAGARVGTLIAAPEVIRVVQKVIAPYAIPQLTLETVLSVLSPLHIRSHGRRMQELKLERERLCVSLSRLETVQRVYPSDANFIFARMADAARALKRAARARIMVRDARAYAGLENGLRITVGTPEQNDRLIGAWQ